MNTPNEAETRQETTWVGVSYVVAENGSVQQRRGLIGGYGFVTFRAASLDHGVRALASELAEGGTKLVGFEWLSRLEDNERELTPEDYDLVGRLEHYPVQFHEIHWFTSEVEKHRLN